MKKAKKLTALFLTGSLALCAMPTNTNAGFISRFLGSKHGGIAIASALVSVAALTKFYVKDEGIEGGLFPHIPFYLKALGGTVMSSAKNNGWMTLCFAASIPLALLFGRKIAKKASIAGQTVIGIIQALSGVFTGTDNAPQENTSS